MGMDCPLIENILQRKRSFIMADAPRKASRALWALSLAQESSGAARGGRVCA